jgi:protein-L-isoaspartate O-methyltransferase
MIALIGDRVAALSRGFFARVTTPIFVATVLASVSASILAMAGQEISFLGPARVPASAFPKFDRPVATIISPIWHTEEERDAVNEVGQVVRWLGISPAMTIADIGAGSGYYAVRLSPIVGADGRIIAEDVRADYLQGLRQRVRDLGLKNVMIGLGEPHDPRLPSGSIDVAILVHAYHEIAQPYALLYNLVPALKPGGRVGIVDATKETLEHGTPPTLLRCELAAVGYQEIGFHPLSGSDAYLAIFAPPSLSNRPAPESITVCKE